MIYEGALDDNGAYSSWMFDPERGWPKCDLCGKVMDKNDSKCEVGIFAAICQEDGFTLSFNSCRKSHRYCAWDQLTDWEKVKI